MENIEIIGECYDKQMDEISHNYDCMISKLNTINQFYLKSIENAKSESLDKNESSNVENKFDIPSKWIHDLITQNKMLVDMSRKIEKSAVTEIYAFILKLRNKCQIIKKLKAKLENAQSIVNDLSASKKEESVTGVSDLSGESTGLHEKNGIKSGVTQEIKDLTDLILQEFNKCRQQSAIMEDIIKEIRSEFKATKQLFKESLADKDSIEKVTFKLNTSRLY